MCRSEGVEITTRVDKTKQPTAPWLSLWESWLGVAETERALQRFLNDNVKEPPPIMSFRASEVSRGIFPSNKFYLVLLLFCHVVDSSTPLALRSE